LARSHQGIATLEQLVRSCPQTGCAAGVSRAVNKAVADGADLIAPLTRRGV